MLRAWGGARGGGESRVLGGEFLWSGQAWTWEGSVRAGTRLYFPGSLSLSGPRTVTGTIGGSLSVQCRYDEEYREHKKYWCRNSKWPPWRKKIVETTESEREVSRGRVSIRDHPANLTFTVTLESLTEADTGSYCCGIDTSWFERVLREPTFQVEVSVVPGEPYSSSTPKTLCSSLPVTVSSQVPALQHPLPEPGLPGGALLLRMLGAVLWVNRPQRGSGGRQSQPAQGSPPCSPLSP
uniref:Ig-like domain-containing protein n=1 Tax=Equus caballus TaxID=9796 RepID=A0A9L0RXU5_HORSE